VRFRKAMMSAYLTGIPWGEEFMRAYAAALEGVKEKDATIGASRTIPGSISALCVLYYRSADFAALKATTQADRRAVIEKFRASHGDKPLNKLRRVHVQEIIGGKAATREAANSLLKALHVLFGHAMSLDLIASNPATGIKRFKSSREGYHTWTEAEIERFETVHPVGSKARLALTLLLHTAQRREDVVRLGWQHINGDGLSLRQEKPALR
jgi:integrase